MLGMSPATEAAIAAVAQLPARQPTTNPPVCTAQCGPEKLTHQDNVRLDAAVAAANRRWPRTALAELITREIHTWKDITHRYDTKGLIGRLVAELLNEPSEAA